MKKSKELLNKLKKLYNKYKEAKKDPRKKAGMKLLGYLIFFIIFFILTAISSAIKSGPNINNNTTTTTTTKQIDKYVEKQNKILKDKYNINYKISFNSEEYLITGSIENNIINGYLENANERKEIIIKNNEIYEINNNTENKLEISFNINYISLEYILETIKQTSAFIQEKENEKTYLYELDEENIKIYVKTDENNITEINIEEFNNQYILKFDI